MKYIPRNDYLQFLISHKDKKVVKVVSGIRRSGKSTLFEIYKDYLLKKLALPTLIIAWAASYYIEVMGYSVKNHRMIQPIFWVMVALYLINA